MEPVLCPEWSARGLAGSRNCFYKWNLSCVRNGQRGAWQAAEIVFTNGTCPVSGMVSAGLGRQQKLFLQMEPVLCPEWSARGLAGSRNCFYKWNLSCVRNGQRGAWQAAEIVFTNGTCPVSGMVSAGFGRQQKLFLQVTCTDANVLSWTA